MSDLAGHALTILDDLAEAVAVKAKASGVPAEALATLLGATMIAGAVAELIEALKADDDGEGNRPEWMR